MDVEKLIEHLRRKGLSRGSSLGHHSGLFDEAADALSTLQAENDNLRDAADSWKKKFTGLDKAVRNGSVYRPIQEELNLTHEENQSLKDENEKLQAELEQVKNERDSVRATLYYLQLYGLKEI